MKNMLFIIALCTIIPVGAQDLQTLLDIGMEHNPEIKKIRLRYEIADEKVREVNTIPNTEISYGYFISEPETRTGTQKMKFSVKQMLPWFGSITARENYATAISDAQFEEITIAKRKLAVTISKSYYKLNLLKEKERLLGEELSLIELYETMALKGVETGKATAVDLLRIQMRQNELYESKTRILHDYRNETGQLNRLLNRPASTEIIISDPLPMPENDLEFDQEDLQLHPELLKYDKLYASVQQFEALNQKEKSPLIGFGIDYIPVAERTDVDFTDNGKDILMPMVSFSIPIFNHKYRSSTKQNKLKILEIEASKEEKLIELQRMLDHAIHGRRAARRSYELQLLNIDRADDTAKLILTYYETGTARFDDILEIEELKLKFRTALLEAIYQYYDQSTMINYLSL